MATVKQLREQRNWTQQELSEISSVSLKTIYSMENGKPVSKKSLLRVARAMQVPMESIDGIELTRKPSDSSEN